VERQHKTNRLNAVLSCKQQQQARRQRHWGAGGGGAKAAATTTTTTALLVVVACDHADGFGDDDSSRLRQEDDDAGNDNGAHVRYALFSSPSNGSEDRVLSDHAGSATVALLVSTLGKLLRFPNGCFGRHSSNFSTRTDTTKIIIVDCPKFINANIVGRRELLVVVEFLGNNEKESRVLGDAGRCRDVFAKPTRNIAYARLVVRDCWCRYATTQETETEEEAGTISRREVSRRARIGRHVSRESERRRFFDSSRR